MKTRAIDDPQIIGLAEKIARVLAVKPEYFVTQPAELRALRALSNEELNEFARQRGWRTVRRIGGLQIEFYNGAGVRL